MLTDFKDEDFDNKIKNEDISVIQFSAAWCGPCKAVAPVLEELGKEYEGKVKVYKVNTETEQELAGVFGIRSIPSLLFVPVGEKPQMAAGALPKEQFVQAFNDVLGVAPVTA